VPLVFIDRPPHYLDADAVLSDNYGGARLAAEHLLRHGHTRIAFLGDRHTLHTAAERLRGYQSSVTEPLVCTDLDTAESAEAATHKLLDEHAPTALLTGQNLITIGAARALRTRGEQHRIALVGFDDVPLADLLDPGITVVAQQPVELGRQAASRLFARIDGDTGPTQSVTIATQLVERGSGEIRPASR
jgi:LacI family transcriptional regulator